MSQARTAGWGVLLSSPSRYCLLLSVCSLSFSDSVVLFVAGCFPEGHQRERSILCINNLGKNFSCKIRDQTIWWRTGKVGYWGGAFIPSSRKVSSSPCSSITPFTQKLGDLISSLLNNHAVNGETTTLIWGIRIVPFKAYDIQNK